VVRVSYPDLIGVDRGRDVLLDVLPAALEHGLAFCRAVYHTSPMGDVVPVPGGLDAGLPDIEVFPDLSSLATFMAKPFNDEGGSGFHVHVSMNDETGRNVFGDPGGPDGLSAAGRHAIGGVLAHARALSALLNPTINSYKRFGPDTLAPWLIDWGLDNRSAMVRVPPDRGPGARMEIRLGDATANPYLAMAAVGAAVCLGIADKVEPGDKLEGYGYDPDRSQILPMRLGDALDALAADRELADVLGSYFVSSFLTYKRNEIERFECYVTDWEFREYAYHL